MSLALTPNIIFHKAKNIFSALEIPEELNLKIVWIVHQYFWKKRRSKRNDIEIIRALEELGSIINKYDPFYVYNMDESSLFF